MDIKIFIGAFVTIFMAEFLDKTQLAVMAASASTKSPFSIFAGAASALVVSTALAVLVGSLLQKYIPQQYVNGGAGIFFIIIGVLLVLSVFKGEAEAKIEPEPGKIGFSAKMIFQAALEFEKNALERYQAMAEQVTSSHLKALFQHLALEEQEHLNHIEKYAFNPSLAKDELFEEKVRNIPPLEISADDDRIIDEAIKHEQQTFSFYHTLAQKALIPAIKRSFQKLAEEEKSHIAHLEEFKQDGIFHGVG